MLYGILVFVFHMTSRREADSDMTTVTTVFMENMSVHGEYERIFP